MQVCVAQVSHLQRNRPTTVQNQKENSAAVQARGRRSSAGATNGRSRRENGVGLRAQYGEGRPRGKRCSELSASVLFSPCTEIWRGE